MPVQRNNPYGAFNFRVTIERVGGGDPESIPAGFQEVSGIGTEVAIAEYRNGNERENHVRKLIGLKKTSDATFKRGVIGVKDFYDWITLTGDGDQNVRTTITVELMDEARTSPVMTWRLIDAVPMKYTGATLNAKSGTDVAMEELSISYTKLVVE
jgi:phage tail-like protein